ncbi:MAG TPA: hypothetical protein V6C76_05980 [Drouetiella sp.]
MIQQTITTIINGITTTIEVNTAKDGSSKIRLQQMRKQKGKSLPANQFSYDNFLRGQIAANVCMRRIIQANKIGLYYWHQDKEVDAIEYSLDPYTRKQTAETVYMDMMHQKPMLGTSMEYAKSTDSNTELSCLSSFMAASMKDKMVGKYVLVKSTNSEKYISGPAQPDVLALPDKSSDSYRRQYAEHQEQYAHRLQEQRLLPNPDYVDANREHVEEIYFDQNASYEVQWQSTPAELQGAPLLVDEPILPAIALENPQWTDLPAEKKTRKKSATPRKPRKPKAEAVVADNLVQFEGAATVDGAAEAAKPARRAKPRVKKEKDSSTDSKPKGGRSKKAAPAPALALVL